MTRNLTPLLSTLCLSLLVGCGGPSSVSPSNEPLITPSSQTPQTASANQQLTFEVTARDPKGLALSFSWSATVGTLGTAESDASSSRVTWTAPRCLAAGTTATLTATVTNDSRLTSSQSFTVSGLLSCASWSSVSLPNSMHSFSQSTLLPDGRVFVSGSDILDEDAEVYDPVTDQWSHAGPPGEMHHGGTATLLPDGTVLVTGYLGASKSDPVLYSPTTNTWHPTGAMVTPRPSGYTTTLLPNGKVLVAGGIVGTVGHFTRTGMAELYDPATGTWSSTGSMSRSRDGHAAMLLPDGKVLVIGGVSGDGSLKDEDLEWPKTSELYDPTTGTWSPTGVMAHDRAFDTPTALLLGGKVLVSSASTDHADPSVRDESYDPATGIWSAVGLPHERRNDHVVTLLDHGQVLVAGGYCEDDHDVCRTSRLYDPVTSIWSEPTRMIYKSHLGATGVRLRTGQVLVVGGLGARSAELYTP